MWVVQDKGRVFKIQSFEMVSTAFSHTTPQPSCFIPDPASSLRFCMM